MCAGILSKVNFESFDDRDVFEVLSELEVWGTAPLIGMLEAASDQLTSNDEKRRHFGFCLLGEIETKVEELDAAIKQLQIQWDKEKGLGIELERDTEPETSTA